MAQNDLINFCGKGWEDVSYFSINWKGKLYSIMLEMILFSEPRCKRYDLFIRKEGTVYKRAPEGYGVCLYIGLQCQLKL